MTVPSVFSGVNATSSAGAPTTSTVGTGFSSMGATDFLKLLTVQMQQQDPTDPVDNKDMLAQMAQFSSLSNSTEMNSTLKAIAVKLGAIDATTGAPTTNTTTTTDPTSGVA
jgi:flagellar basal-body rod modification protein FlgD